MALLHGAGLNEHRAVCEPLSAAQCPRKHRHNCEPGCEEDKTLTRCAGVGDVCEQGATPGEITYPHRELMSVATVKRNTEL